MKQKKVALMVIVVLFFLTPVFAEGDAPVFKIQKLNPRIYLLSARELGGQLGIVSQRGIVLLDSFSSASTARLFRAQWEKALSRKDFVYTLNTVDRLDIFGGNSAFKDTTIVGHQVFYEKFTKAAVDAEMKRLIKMWRWKEDVSRKRQPTHKAGSKEAKIELNWTAFCKRRAEALEAGFELVLPRITFSDRLQIHLGDISVELIALGRAGYDGHTIVVVPEEKTAIISGFILHSQHLAPHPQNRYAKLDVPRWIRILEELTDEKGRVDKYIVDSDSIWTRERVRSHLRYIKTLWNRVKDLEAEGKSLEWIQDQLSLEKEFAFVKEMQPYKEHGDGWIRPQHRAHIWNFYVQHKKLASLLIRKLIPDHGAREAIRLVKTKAEKHKKIYFDQASINSLGYLLLNGEKVDDALTVLRLNTEMFPKSANTWDSLGEAWMKKGDSLQAKKCYQKSLALNPKNENARKMLDKLNKK